MKKITIILLLSLAFTVCKAQISIPKTSAASALKNFVKPPAIGDIGKTSNGITDNLGSALSLPGSKKSLLTEAISGFLKKKSGIVGLAGSNPTSYLSKFAPMQGDLFGKIKDIVGGASYDKFLKLKPPASEAKTNILSNLFF